MTTMAPVTAGPTEIWSSMPGWGIVADLTPPELIEARRLKVLRRLIFSALIVLVVACLGIFVVAKLGHASAQSALDAEQARTTSLNQTEHQYSDVTQIQADTDTLNTQLATVLATDVDLQPVLTRIRKVLPAQLDIKSLALTLTPATGTGAVSSGLDTSGHPIIGNITIQGESSSFQAISAYVDALSQVNGIVNVIPTSAQGNKLTITYNITLNLVDTLYSHRFDVTKKAGN